MKIFHCDNCDQLVYFENSKCLNCGSVLAYVPGREDLCSLEMGADGAWKVPGKEHGSYLLCTNYVNEQVCNWAVNVEDNNPFCASCRLTTKIPDLTVAGNKEAWTKIERAKHRLVYSLLHLGLPVVSKQEEPETGLSFEFLADDPEDGPVLTGHDNGLITLNIAEADDAEREKRRMQLGEPYRTLLGHFRHEVGHYYWDRLIRDGGLIDSFREIFGDESRDYGDALKAHYAQGAPANWRESFISSYATAHPWEDWAETWAHYLHMVDLLETAASYQLGVTVPTPPFGPQPAMRHTVSDPFGSPAPSFDDMVGQWVPVTLLLNSLNRSLGQSDAYPFALSAGAMVKLRFVHDLVQAVRQPPAQAA